MAGTDDPLWLVEQAWRQVGRAQTAEDRARGLSTFRRTLATAAKQLGEVTPEIADRIGTLEAAARDLNEEAEGQHVRKALRALGSLRMAVEARLAARIGGEQSEMRVIGFDGNVLTTWQTDRDQALNHYGIPHEHANDRIVVQMTWGGQPDVRVYRGRGIVWRRPAKPSAKPRRRKVPGAALNPTGRHDRNGNGHRRTERA